MLNEMHGKLKFFLSLFLFVIFSTLISYHVIGDTKLSRIREIAFLSENILLKKIIEPNLKLPKLFCIILTSEKSYKQKAKIIYESWANKCDDYRFITMVPNDISKTNETLLSNEFKNKSIEFNYDKQLKFLQPADLIHDSYEELTAKVYHTIKDVYKRHNYFDWYLKADDDTFIFVDNLKKFLSEKNSSMPITYGYNFKVIVPNGYHSGGKLIIITKITYFKYLFDQKVRVMF
jgi:hypothetical protein